ncbi:MAG: VOC family protein [Actinomycetota bacterium]|nr:VOC family protein [Actinomycetota bacterium]
MAALAIDHLVYAAPDLDRGVGAIAELLGVTARPGGSHDGLGTRNALAGLGGRCYLEIIAPDPGQPAPLTPRPFGIDELTAPRLVTFALRCHDVGARLEEARRAGYDGGEVVHMSRSRPDGVMLSWKLSNRLEAAHGGLVPFLIDWGDTPHPSETLDHDVELVEVTLEHPDPDTVAADLAALGAELAVRRADTPSVVATIDTAAGKMNLV